MGSVDPPAPRGSKGGLEGVTCPGSPRPTIRTWRHIAIDGFGIMHRCIGCKERPEIRRSDGLEAAAGAIVQSWPQSSRPIPSACRAETPLHRLSTARGNRGRSGRGIAGGRVGPHPVPGGLQGGVEGPTDPEGPQTHHKLSCQEAVKCKNGPQPVRIWLIAAQPSYSMPGGAGTGSDRTVTCTTLPTDLQSIWSQHLRCSRVSSRRQ